MSMVTYIGFNFPMEISDDLTEKEVEIDILFSGERDRQNVKEKHFTTQYIYELSMRNEPIWQMYEYYQQHKPQIYEEAKRTFFSTVELLKVLLPEGDYCEIYSCWLAEEEEEQEASLTIALETADKNVFEIFEKCFIRIEN